MPEFRDRDKYIPAYEKYLQNVSMSILKCRIYGHDIPDLDVELRRKNSTARVWKTRRGSTVIQVECKRKCGTIVTRFRAPGGYIEKANRVQHVNEQDERKEYDYDNPRYLLPPEARSGHGLTKEMNAMAREEELNRLAEYITEE